MPAIMTPEQKLRHDAKLAQVMERLKTALIVHQMAKGVDVWELGDSRLLLSEKWIEELVRQQASAIIDLL